MLEFSREHNSFCYIFNLEHRLFSISPLLHLPHPRHPNLNIKYSSAILWLWGNMHARISQVTVKTWKLHWFKLQGANHRLSTNRSQPYYPVEKVQKPGDWQTKPIIIYNQPYTWQVWHNKSDCHWERVSISTCTQ